MVAQAAFDVACVIKHVTRFTDDCFAGLISIVFITTATRFLVKISDEGKRAPADPHAGNPHRYPRCDAAD